MKTQVLKLVELGIIDTSFIALDFTLISANAKSHGTIISLPPYDFANLLKVIKEKPPFFFAKIIISYFYSIVNK
jgi:hypothetical protein